MLPTVKSVSGLDSASLQLMPPFRAAGSRWGGHSRAWGHGGGSLQAWGHGGESLQGMGSQ